MARLLPTRPHLLKLSLHPRSTKGWGPRLQQVNIHGPFQGHATVAMVVEMVVMMEDEDGDIHSNNGDAGADGTLLGRL